MKRSRALGFALSAVLLGAYSPPPASAERTPALRSPEATSLGLDPVFDDGFESSECSYWSATTNPLGAPDADEDLWGDESQPTVYCQLPAGFVANDDDCDDLEATTYPGAPELCDLQDNNCDGSLADDGGSEPWLGQPCDGPGDTDLCVEGTFLCQTGTQFCSDQTSSTVEICDGLGGDEDCDGAIDEGFVVNQNPLCANGTLDLGTIDGDVGSEMVTASDYPERWLTFTVAEAATGFPGTPLRASIALTPPAGTDFDLYVYCTSCGGTLVGSSTSGGPGVMELVAFGRDDDVGLDDSIDLIVEVRYVSGGPCANWSLSILGNAGSGASECP